VKNSVNSKGGMETIPNALVGLLTAVLVLYVVVLIWQPITSTMLFPLLNNSAAFAYGGVAVTILQITILVAAVAILIVFFQDIRGGGREQPPTAYYG
jgi:hypothetical protein